MRSTFWRLYKKEIEASRSFFLISTAIILIWQFFLASSRRGVWPVEAIFILAWFPFGFLPLWFMVDTFNSYRQEWNGNTIYLLLTLPVKGWEISGAKLLASFTKLVFSSLLVVGGNFLILSHEMRSFLEVLPEGIPILDTTVKACLLYLGAMLILGITIQFSFLAGRLVDRFQGLLSVWVFFLTQWITSRWVQLTAPAFKWIPYLTFKWEMIKDGIKESQFVEIDMAPVASLIIITIFIFLAGSWLLERELEV